MLTLFLLDVSARTAPARRSPFESLTILARALSQVEMHYVEPIDQRQLVYGAIEGMLGSLDPHTAFLDPEEYRILESDTEGHFAGIGVEVASRDGWLTVLSVFEGGPAARAGLQPGDRFLTIQDEDARDIRLSDAVRKMRGKSGTKVRVSIRREGVEQALQRELTRAVIAVDPVEGRLLPGRIAYVKLKAFQDGTTSRLREALDDAADKARKTKGIGGVLVDLRNNGGGLLSEAVSVSDEFLGKGVIVSTRGRGGKRLRAFEARRGGTRPNWPVVVLVNEYTASAAEIVAGAWRDHKRAKLVGARTFGKGSVQELIELPDGSAMKLTVARYYTPAGISIQAQGIDPDVEVGANELTVPVFREESLPRHLEPGASTPAKVPEKLAIAVSAASETVFPKDRQAQVAYQLLLREVTD